MSKVLLAAGLDMLREAEKHEAEAERAYEAIIKSGNKVKDFTPVREGLRSAYQKFVKALEVVNYVRRASSEAERMQKLKRQLARLNGETSGGGGDANGGSEAENKEVDNMTSEEKAQLIADAAKQKQQHNLRRGLAAVSDEIIRNGIPAEVTALCEERMNAAMQRCERIRTREASLLLSVRDTDPGGKMDCSKSRPGFVVARILAYRGATEELQGNFTVTIPVSDGSYQVLVKNITDHLVAAPDVSVQAIATWGVGGSEKKTYQGICPPGCAFLRSVGIVGPEGSLFVNVNSTGMRHSSVEVIVRQLVPASVAQMAEKQQQQQAQAQQSQQSEGQQQPPPQQLQNLLPPLMPLGVVMPQQQQQQPTAEMLAQQAVPHDQYFQLPQHDDVHPDDLTPPPPGGYVVELPPVNFGAPAADAGAGYAAAPAASAAASVAQPQQPPQDSQQQQPRDVATLNAQQLKDRIVALIDKVNEFPDEVMIPMEVADGDDDAVLGEEGKPETEEQKQKREARRAADEAKLAAESQKRTDAERQLEDFVATLPPPTDLFGSGGGEGDDDLMDLMQNLGANLDDLKEMEEALTM